jgi:hypothetical protein
LNLLLRKIVDSEEGSQSCGRRGDEGADSEVRHCGIWRCGLLVFLLLDASKECSVSDRLAKARLSLCLSLLAQKRDWSEIYVERKERLSQPFTDR